MLITRLRFKNRAVLVGEMTESALIRACKVRNTSAVRTSLKNGQIDLSHEMYSFKLEGWLLTLFVEYGHPVPCKSVIQRYSDFVAYFDHDMTFCKLQFSEENLLACLCVGLLRVLTSQLSLFRSMHHLLRYHGEFHFEICKSMLKWIAIDHNFAKVDVFVMEDLRFAIMYGVEEWQAKRMAMIILQSEARDWFISFLGYFRLSIDEEYPDFGVGKIFKPALHQTILTNFNSEVLLKFLVEECNANINMRDSKDQLTALIALCFYHPPKVSKVQCMIDLGADMNAVFKYGQTVLDYAVDKTKQKTYLAFGVKKAWGYSKNTSSSRSRIWTEDKLHFCKLDKNGLRRQN